MKMRGSNLDAFFLSRLAHRHTPRGLREARQPLTLNPTAEKRLPRGSKHVHRARNGDTTGHGGLLRQLTLPEGCVPPHPSFG